MFTVVKKVELRFEEDLTSPEITILQELSARNNSIDEKLVIHSNETNFEIYKYLLDDPKPNTTYIILVAVKYVEEKNLTLHSLSHKTQESEITLLDITSIPNNLIEKV